MHELGVVYHIIKQLDDVRKENELTKIGSVTIELGEVSTVIPHFLEDCWNWAREKHDYLKECEIKIEPIHAITHCEDCGTDYDTVPQGRICPNCGSEKTFLLQGNEFMIKEIEAY